MVTREQLEQAIAALEAQRNELDARQAHERPAAEPARDQSSRS